MKTKFQKSIPSEFQPILWSKNIKDLDLKKDKIYIIHQILSYGNLEQIKWLFKIYKKSLSKIPKENIYSGSFLFY
jgi:Cu/Ag efflux protein CusF